MPLALLFDRPPDAIPNPSTSRSYIPDVAGFGRAPAPVRTCTGLQDTRHSGPINTNDALIPPKPKEFERHTVGLVSRPPPAT